MTSERATTSDLPTTSDEAAVGLDAAMERVGRVQTVRGLVDPSTLGVTLPHEHLFFAVNDALIAPAPDPALTAIASAPLSLETLWFANAYSFAARDNLRLDDFEAACAEAAAFQEAGGGTIVELTTKGISPDPASMRRLSARTGLNVVAGTGWYTAATRPRDFIERTATDLAAEMTGEILEGFAGTDGVRAGIIGELAIEGSGVVRGVRSVRYLDPGDVHLLEAAAIAQRATGVAISLHAPKSGLPEVSAVPTILDILDILADGGADLRRVIVGHADSTSFESVGSLAAVAARGAMVEIDAWGWEGFLSLDSWAPSDAHRLKLTRGLIAEGLAGQLLLSQDVCEKRQWRRFGGRGYAHIPTFVVPLLRHHRVPEAAIDQMLIENPAKLLTIAAPAAG